LLGMICEAASRATAHAASGSEDKEKSRALHRASQLLASLVLSTIPYVLSASMGNALARLSEMVDALETNVVGSTVYSSMYDPASGPLSVLLQGELDDASPGDAEMDEEDDEEEDEGDSPAPCADTLQDLLRTVRKLIVSCEDNFRSVTRFALLDDAPWKTLTVELPMETGMDNTEQAVAQKAPMSHEGEPLTLDLIGNDETEQRCKSIPHLLNIDNLASNEVAIQISCRSLDGIILGRLAIFDLPSDPNDSDADDEEEAKETNPNMQAYISNYSLIDRFFLADSVRDVLTCHRPMVSDAGAERNTGKEVAEQIWAVSHLFKPAAAGAEGNEPPLTEVSKPGKGIEYGIIETILSLLVQTTLVNSATPSSSPLHCHLYLSRVLLELTKLQPTLIPQALVLAVNGMFQDFLPSLTPSARESLGEWFGFHLVNTGGQWPKAYWDHWAPYVSTGGGGGITNSSSRGEFIKTTLHSMASMFSSGAVYVIEECLPHGSSLVQSVFLNSNENDIKEEVSSVEKDLIHRLWSTSEDPDDIRTYVISDELAESHTSNSSAAGNGNASNMHHASVWWRSGLAIRALFHPLQQENLRMAKLTRNTTNNGDGGNTVDDITDNNAMDDDSEEGNDETEDMLADISDAISRFKPVILAALARDADAYDSIATGKVDDDELLLAGEVAILEEIANIVTTWDLATMNAILLCLMKERILSGLAVARWALGEDQRKDGSGIHTHWWKHVSCAFRHVLRDANGRFEISKTDLGGGIGMIVDDVGQQDDEDKSAKEVAAALRLEEALKTVVPIVKYVMERACHILGACGSEKKRIPLHCADVMEGMKRLLCALLFHFHSLLLVPPSSGKDGDGSANSSSSSILPASSIQKGLASMDADGEKLAFVCQSALVSCKGDQGKKLLQTLMLSIEKLC